MRAVFSLAVGIVYNFGIEAKKIIILLIGGDKKTQSTDIKKAKGYWKAYLGALNGKKK